LAACTLDQLGGLYSRSPSVGLIYVRHRSAWRLSCDIVLDLVRDLCDIVLDICDILLGICVRYCASDLCEIVLDLVLDLCDVVLDISIDQLGGFLMIL
jgi:hypothetical protein